MVDPRLEKQAEVLVRYSTEVQPGQWVLIQSDLVAVPLAREVSLAVLRAGGHPTVLYGDGGNTDRYLKTASDAQLEWVSPLHRQAIEQADVIISLWASENTRSLTNTDPAKMARAQKAQGHLLETLIRRMAADEVHWVGTQFPAQGDAQEAEMSLSEYEDFVFGAMLLDKDDPVAEWRRVSERQQRLVEWLRGKKGLTIQSAHCELTLSIEGRAFENADGHKNMPDGEIFTSPVEDSVNGWVRFTYPAIYGGRAVEGVELRFEDGKVVEARAEKNEAFLLSQLDIDAGARYLGEFAIGTNFGITQFTGNTLFDEKIGGTIHMAVGRGFPETGSKNESAIHWDMVCDMREGGEIHVDGELFYQDGAFVV